ncbi:nucleotide-binding universal stress UspA family protein [Scopulibacillus darangshiensis]|uniref:Nucleotide-binding universal stress UspA family protein n=1 Tax=Scopulibacillus darangshiensis TaxID=442528 RepID=A0A4R2ND52_9BACL|nr:universal stress protein [Scopulibacillus darangshiensis]TCP18994.1 nucleotide-binding universal stress UspA family protein [Scopulibacillus darangshiensis]
MKKILVPVDGSEQSMRALNEALSIAEGKESGYAISLINVSPDPVYFPYYPIGGGQLNKNVEAEMNEEAKREGEQLLTTIKNETNAPRLNVDIVHLEGVPSHEICRYADENNYDMIVMGNRGRGAFGEIILGSVSHKVLHLAPCPVLIVK